MHQVLACTHLSRYPDTTVHLRAHLTHELPVVECRLEEGEVGARDGEGRLVVGEVDVEEVVPRVGGVRLDGGAALPH